MTTRSDVSWAITAAGDWTRVHRQGTATTRAEAWLAALAAGRAALVAGELDDLAFAVDDALPTAIYHPARDDAGRLDPYEVTATLVEIYQGETAVDVAAAIVGAATA